MVPVYLVEFLECDVTVAVIIGLCIDAIDLRLSDIFTQLSHHFAELADGDLSILVLIEDLECLDDEVILIFLHALDHHLKLVELYDSISVRVNLHQNVDELVVVRILTHLPENTSQLVHIYLTILVLVKHIKDFAHLSFIDVVVEQRHHLILILLIF